MVFVKEVGDMSKDWRSGTALSRIVCSIWKLESQNGTSTIRGADRNSILIIVES